VHTIYMPPARCILFLVRRTPTWVFVERPSRNLKRHPSTSNLSVRHLSERGSLREHGIYDARAPSQTRQPCQIMGAKPQAASGSAQWLDRARAEADRALWPRWPPAVTVRSNSVGRQNNDRRVRLHNEVAGAWQRMHTSNAFQEFTQALRTNDPHHEAVVRIVILQQPVPVWTCTYARRPPSERGEIRLNEVLCTASTHKRHGRTDRRACRAWDRQYSWGMLPTPHLRDCTIQPTLCTTTRFR